MMAPGWQIDQTRALAARMGGSFGSYDAGALIVRDQQRRVRPLVPNRAALRTYARAAYLSLPPGEIQTARQMAHEARQLPCKYMLRPLPSRRPLAEEKPPAEPKQVTPPAPPSTTTTTPEGTTLIEETVVITPVGEDAGTQIGNVDNGNSQRVTITLPDGGTETVTVTPVEEGAVKQEREGDSVWPWILLGGAGLVGLFWWATRREEGST